MELLIVRHAIAEDRRPGLRDEDRKLTAKGKKRFQRHVAALGQLGLAPTVILHSPWRRAVQTAELVAAIGKASLQVEAGLAQGPDEALLAALAAFEGPDARPMVIGHQPWLSELAGWLVWGRAQGADERLRLKKGGAVLLEGVLSPGAMRLAALLPPRVLRSIAS
ncbi:MAG: histidine phosphatase family protein [Sandaracinaceae bacterium]